MRYCKNWNALLPSCKRAHRLTLQALPQLVLVNSSRCNKVFFTASNNKGEELWSSDIPVISGVEETPADEMSAILFPNPANQLLMVKAGTLSIDKVNIYNASGQLLLTTRSSKIDVSLLNAGIYYAEVTTSEGLLRNRFIKQ